MFLMKKWQILKVRKIDGIVGGHLARPGEHPHQVSLRSKTAFKKTLGHFCGGAIVGKKSVLTAAHCVDIITDLGIDNVYVEAGTTCLSPFSHVVTRDVEFVKKYEGHVMGTVIGDLAIVTVRNSFDFNGIVSPISIAKQNVADGSICFVTGWGQWAELDKQFYSNLKCARLPIINPNKRLRMPGTLLAGHQYGSSCHGDSGGPLVHNGKLVGIVCGGFGCGLPGYYTNIHHYLSWLKENGIKIN
ncbi:chymotrypsin-1-like [Lycorma delicatula]|uniref:chymotrypsin-1-like n=1 Tax=Lycorma delicatula TaxID=130591 RepID=UPI003F514948